MAAEEEEARRRTSSVGVRRPPAPDDGDGNETRQLVLSRTNVHVVPDQLPPAAASLLFPLPLPLPPLPRRRLRR
jgi:hypothetical protein